MARDTDSASNTPALPEGRRFKSALEILETDDLGYEDVWVDDWQSLVRIKKMSGKERDAYEASMADLRVPNAPRVQLHNLRARLVARTAVDPQTGARLFTPEQVEVLGDKSARALDQLVDVAQRLAGLDRQSMEAMAKALGEAKPDETGIV